MKKLIVAVLSVFVAAGLWAQPAKEITFAGPGTQVETNLEFYVVPLGDGVPRIEFLQAVSDSATAGVLTFLSKPASTNNAITVYASTTTTNLPIVGTGSGIVSNDVVVIRDTAGNYFRRQVYGAASATNVALTAAVTAGAGSKVWKVSSVGTYLVGSATATVNAAGGGIVNGHKDWPLLVELAGAGTNTVDIKVVSGKYVK
jgi:hypothetical protein